MLFKKFIAIKPLVAPIWFSKVSIVSLIFKSLQSDPNYAFKLNFSSIESLFGP